MSPPRRSLARPIVAAIVVLASLGVGLGPAAGADPAPDDGTGLSVLGAPEVRERVTGTETPAPEARQVDPAARAAVDDVTFTSLGCTPASILVGEQSSCAFQAQNHGPAEVAVDLSATGDGQVRVVGADQGATVADGSASATGVRLPGATGSHIGLVNGAPTGFLPLAQFAIPVRPVVDGELLHVDVEPFRWNGAIYTQLGISANGYVIPGGGHPTEDDTATPQALPDPARPNNVLAPFWTDLTPDEGQGMRMAYLNTAGEVGVRQVFQVVEWRMLEAGTSTPRAFQLWLSVADPLQSPPGQVVPPEQVFFTYDTGTMAAAPVRPFRIGAEDGDGTHGTSHPAGALPGAGLTVRSDVALTPGAPVTWSVTGQGTATGTGTVSAALTSPAVVGPRTASGTVTVAEPAPVVTTDPADLTVTARDQAVFSAAATGAASVRWEVSTDDGASWSDVPGATATTLAFTAQGDQDGHRFRAVFRSGSGVETATAAAALTVDAVAVTVTVTVDPAAPAVGEAVSFTASLRPATATGTVQFAVDGTPLGDPVAVGGGEATSPPISSLAAGDHLVTAAYSGDRDHGPTTVEAGVSVGKVETTTTVEPTPAAPVVGDEVTFTAAVSPTAATGTVQFVVDGEPLGAPVPLAGGTATSPSWVAADRGGHVVTATYSGDDARAISSSGPVSFSVARRPTTTTLVVDPAAPVRGDGVTFTATVAPAPAEGTVRFAVDGDLLGGPVALSAGGTATSAAVSDLAAGDHVVTATYSGDDTHAPSTSSATSFTVARAPSATTVEVRPAVRGEGDDVVIDVAVLPVPAGGTVALEVDGGATGPPLALDGAGRATATLPGVARGSHTVVATFSGDDDLLPSSDDAPFVVHSSDEAFVRRAFEVVLDRPADPGGVAHWLGVLDGGASREAVVRHLARSAEGRGLLVDQAYQRALVRNADAGGRAHWVGRVQRGMTPADLLATLVASAEGYQGSGRHPDGTAITLYRVHLGRSPDPSGLAWWSGRVAAADTPAGRRQVALAFARTDEATATAVRAALVAACGGPGADEGQIEALAQRWAATGRDPLELAGLALAQACPPGSSRT